ncbi:MAG TPA: hypothetical protein VJX66_01625, partial [Amycolatopsis sp.]|nr:hypothetical protein [Amycolatopsis sp.]
RRARLWLGGGAAVLLIALGWVGGGMFGARSDVAASVQARPAVATDTASERKVVPPAQPAPQPQPPAVTVYVPVPAHTATPKHTQPQAKPAPKTESADTPRDDLPKTSTPPSSTMNPVERLVQPFASLAKSMVARYR